jgi:anaerobic selenocysteine-containing dehydrogenase
LELTLAGERVTAVVGYDDDVFSRGFVCPKGANLGALDEDPDRLCAPMIRRNGVLTEATWREAYDEVDARLAAVRAEHGDISVAFYRGNPSAHTIAATPYLRPLVQALNTPNLYSPSTADQMPTQVACGLVYGNDIAIPVPDLDRTTFLVIIGANPVESNGSLCTAPDFIGRLRRIRARGGTVTVIDPRSTKTARLSDNHIAIRPSTDAYLLLAIVHVLIEDNLCALDHYPTRGFAALQELAGQFSPEAVTEISAVAPQSIRSLARDLAGAQSAAVYGRMGTCATAHGTVTNWLIQVVNILTGNLDRPGGAMFPRNPIRPDYRPAPRFSMGRWHSRVRHLPEVAGEYPVATLADEIETPGAGQVRALITYAGNPVLSTPNGARLDRVLRDLSFMVSIDPYLNETTSHADVILPPPKTLQAGHFDWSLASFMVRAVIRYSPPVLPTADDRPTESEILSTLAVIAAGGGPHGDAAGLREGLVAKMLENAVRTEGSPVFGRNAAQLRSALVGRTDVERHLEVMLRLGPYGDGFGAEPTGVTLQQLLDHPEGVDRGPMQPRLHEVVTHADGCIDLCPSAVLPEVERLAEEMHLPRPRFVLIGRRTLRSNNSWMHNLPNLVSGPARCTLQLNVADADALGLAEGDDVVVRSAVGAVTAVAEPTAALRPGVVSLPHGWGHQRSGSRQDVASRRGGVSANDLTDESVIDTLSGNAIFNGVPVTIEPGRVSE